MQRPDLPVRRVLLGGVAVAMLIPPAVFLTTALATGLGVVGSLEALVAQYATSRLNLAVVGGLGVVPFVLLGAALALYRRFVAGAMLRPLAFGSGLVIAATLVWANVTYWRLFLPEQVAPMWPHGLELLIAPLMFAPVLGLGGALVGAIAQHLVASR